MTYFLLPNSVRVDSNSDSKFGHRFGGEPVHKIINSKYKKLRMHCFYLFDTSDPLLPKVLSSSKYLPLYYPLFNNACDFAYEIVNDKEIKIHMLGQQKEEEDFPYENFPEVLPENNVSIVPLSYENQKTLVYSYIADKNLASDYISEEDKSFLINTEYPFTQIGGIQQMLQGIPEQICPNKNCEYHDYSNMHTVFAVVWNNPIQNFTIWGDLGDYVQLIFQICPKCETIHVCNRCD